NAGANGGAVGPTGEPAGRQLRVPLQQDPNDGKHLEDGGHFSSDARANFDFADGRLDDTVTDQYDQIAADDRAGEPKRNAAEVRVIIEGEQNDAGDEQQFVGKRVEDGAEFAALIVMTRNVAVHAVANGGNGKS